MSALPPSVPPPTPPSASGTVMAKLSPESIQIFSEIFSPDRNDAIIKTGLGFAWMKVHDAIQAVGDSKLKTRVRNQSEFKSYVAHGSNEEQLVNLLKRMAKKEVPWEELFENGTLLTSL
jgi:hypothetical protein